MADKSGSKSWSALALATTVVSGIVAKKAMTTAWQAATGRTPPTSAADPDVGLREAVAWAAFSSASVAVIKMLASRRAAGYYRSSTGQLPPGLRPDA